MADGRPSFHVIIYASAIRQRPSAIFYNGIIKVSFYCIAILGRDTTLGADRSAGTGVLDVSIFAGLKVQTYIGFITKDGTSVATSIFTGEVDASVTP